MNIKLKAMLYTAAFIAGDVLLGYLITTFPWYTMAFFASISACVMIGFVYYIVLQNLSRDIK
jgi:hypothetical protein